MTAIPILKILGRARMWGAGVGSLLFTLAAAITLELVSIISFRVIEGMIFAISALVVTVLVYSLGHVSKSWR